MTTDDIHPNRYETAPSVFGRISGWWHKRRSLSARVKRLEGMAHPAITDVLDADDVEQRIQRLERKVAALLLRESHTGND